MTKNSLQIILKNRKNKVESIEQKWKRGRICSNSLQGYKNSFLYNHRNNVNYYFFKMVNNIEIYLQIDLSKQLENKIKQPFISLIWYQKYSIFSSYFKLWCQRKILPQTKLLLTLISAKYFHFMFSRDLQDLLTNRLLLFKIM